MSSSTEQIKDRLSIVDVLSTYMKLDKAGKNFKGKCPFHNEKTPSFFVSPERDSYYCFGCGAKGDIFSFVEHFEGVDFVGALKILAERAGVELSTAGYQDTNPNKRLLALCEEACLFFESELPKSEKAKAYLASRDIKDHTIVSFRIGYIPDEWRLLHDHLAKKGYSVDEMMKAGVVKKKDAEGQNQAHSYYDVFRGRVMFPIFDASGRVIAFSGRILEKSDVAPKYINSPETPLFKKSETLYGFDRARAWMRKYNFSILVEGPIDIIMAHQAGFTNTVAVMGTAFTEWHVDKLLRFSQNLVIALDADDAGMASMMKTARMALRAGMDVKVAALPEGSDPADTISKDLDVWKKAIREASHVIEFLLARTKTLYGKDDRTFKQKVRSDVLPYVSLIENKIDQAHFIERIARALSVEESVVLEELVKVAFPQETKGEEKTHEPQPKAISGRRTHIVRQLAGIIAWQEKTEKKLANFADIVKKAEDALGAHPASFFSPEELGVLAFESERAYEDADILSRHLEEMFKHLSEDMLKEKFAKTMEALSAAEREGDAENIKKLLEECSKLSHEINKLYT